MININKKIKNISIIPNYSVDDEGLPTCCAQGNNPDIICDETGTHSIVEVTLLKGVQQHIRESLSVHRHLETEIEKVGKYSYALFLSLKTHIDTYRYFSYVNYANKLDIKTLDIVDFIKLLETNPTLKDVSFNNDTNYYTNN